MTQTQQQLRVQACEADDRQRPDIAKVSVGPYSIVVWRCDGGSCTGGAYVWVLRGEEVVTDADDVGKDAVAIVDHFHRNWRADSPDGRPKIDRELAVEAVRMLQVAWELMK